MNLYITKQGAKVGVEEGELYIISPEKEELGRFPQKLIENIFIFGNVFLTTQAINFFLKNNIRVIFLSLKGDYIGSLISLDQKRVFFKYKQWEKFKDESLRLKLSKIIIREKFKNQRGLLYNFCRNQLKMNLFLEFDEKTKNLIKEVDFVSSVNSLRGLEGIFSCFYFDLFGQLILNKEFNFNGRNHYPPKDEVNSLLSFGYSLLVNFLTGFIIAYFLDPYVGFYHENKYKRENLSLDLVEELRPNIDQIVLKLINLNMLKKDDFFKENNCFFIKKESLNKVFLLFQKEIINKDKLIKKVENRLRQIVNLIEKND